jgi:hypothetical protein
MAIDEQWKGGEIRYPRYERLEGTYLLNSHDSGGVAYMVTRM